MITWLIADFAFSADEDFAELHANGEKQMTAKLKPF